MSEWGSEVAALVGRQVVVTVRSGATFTGVLETYADDQPYVTIRFADGQVMGMPVTRVDEVT